MVVTMFNLRNKLNALGLVIATSLACTVVAQGDPCKECDSSCTRNVWSTIWGAVVTIFIVAHDAWAHGMCVYNEDKRADPYKFSDRLVVAVIAGPFSPLIYAVTLVSRGFVTTKFIKHVLHITSHKHEGWLEKVRKARIVCGTPLVLGLSRDGSKLDEISSHACCILEDPGVHDTNSMIDSEEQTYFAKGAVVLGGPSADGKYIMLNRRGKEALFLAGLVPPLDQLQKAQGFSGIGLVFTAAQSSGYLVDGIIRLAEQLRVSPIEAVGMVFSVMTLLRVAMHPIASRGEHPVFYNLDLEQEQAFLEACHRTTFTYNGSGQKAVDRISSGLGIIIGTGGGLYIKYLFRSGLHLPAVVVILFAVGSIIVSPLVIYIVEVTGALHVSSKVWTLITMTICISLPFIGCYGLAIVVTVSDWHTSNYDARSVYSQLLPHVG